jgi:hypothetical protein
VLRRLGCGKGNGYGQDPKYCHTVSDTRPSIFHLLVVGLLTTACGAAPAAAQTTVLVDRHVTIGAGASMAVAAGDALSEVEERWVPVRLVAERGVPRRSVDIAYRLLRFALFDAPEERLLLVANHEMFGHGGRLRERFAGPVSYTVDAPPPYGEGGGATYFDFDRAPSMHELLAVSSAGMEANHVAADMIADGAFDRGRIDFQSGLRYLGMRLDATSYIRGTSDAPVEPGHDVSDFLQAYGELARAAGEPPLAPRTIRREALASYADPLLAYSLIAIGRFIATGDRTVPVFTVPLGPVRYLPGFHYRLTPFGTEFVLANALAVGSRTMQVDVRAGRSPGTSPWGIAVRSAALASWARWHVDVQADWWRQPRLALDAAAAVDLSLRSGGELRARVARALTRFSHGSLEAVIEAGVKSNGFVPGEPLAGGPLLRVGVVLPLRH